MNKSVSEYSLYVIELDNDPKRVYVGHTGLTPEERLQQHNTGLLEHSAAKVFRKGARGILRPDLYKAYPKYATNDEALKAGVILSKILTDKGYVVHSEGLKQYNRQRAHRLIFTDRLIASKSNQHTPSIKEIRASQKASNDLPTTNRNDPFHYGKKKYTPEEQAALTKARAKDNRKYSVGSVVGAGGTPGSGQLPKDATILNKPQPLSEAGKLRIKALGLSVVQKRYSLKRKKKQW